MGKVHVKLYFLTSYYCLLLSSSPHWFLHVPYKKKEFLTVEKNHFEINQSSKSAMLSEKAEHIINTLYIVHICACVSRGERIGIIL